MLRSVGEGIRSGPRPIATDPSTQGAWVIRLHRGTPQPEHAPRGARRATTDAIVLVLLGVVAVALAARFRPINAVLGAVPSTDGPLADAVLTLLLVAPVLTAVFARRRYNEAIGIRHELVWLSLHDALTGLPNRRLLSEWLRSDIEASQTRNAQAAVLFVDLDRFKYVNDTHGHEVGDRLMRAVAERLVDVVGDRGRLVRFGGDEFVVLASDVHAANSVVRLAEEVIRTVQQPFTVGNESLRISASVGIALTEHRGVNPDEVLRDADVAMYQAKLNGSGHVVIFDRSMTGRLTPATAEEVIRAALENREFHLYYQPVVDLTSGRIVGAEALLRWISDRSGTMSPGEFIPILEETGLIVPVGTWVLEEACRQAARLRRIFDGPPLTVTVNVSARQIAQVGFVDVVARALEASGADPTQIHLEITEGALMHDVDSAWAALRQVKSLGVKLALDDFGTGYSSLSYVRRFSLDMLKIDKSFIDGVATSHEDRAIVEHVVGMAHALGMSTVAEGVEQPEQLRALRALGCGLAQGYVMSRPIPAGEFEALITHGLDDRLPFDRPSTVPEVKTSAEARTAFRTPAAVGSPLIGPPPTTRTAAPPSPQLPRTREYRAG